MIWTEIPWTLDKDKLYPELKETHMDVFEDQFWYVLHFKNKKDKPPYWWLCREEIECRIEQQNLQVYHFRKKF